MVRTPPVPPAIIGKAVSKDESRDFMAAFPDIVRDLTETGHNLDVPDVTKWLAKVWFARQSERRPVLLMLPPCFRCCSTMCPGERKTVV